MTDTPRDLVKARPRTSMLAALMLAVFTISVGFGIMLPQLPDLIERLLGVASTAEQVSRATGLLTALYMFALFLCAPFWGRLSDQWGRRPVLLIGLVGFAATMLAFAVFETLTAVYVERALSGLFAAAVTPVALAAVTDVSATKEKLGRRLTFVSLAGISGFLLGPTLGVALTRGLGGLGGASGTWGRMPESAKSYAKGFLGAGLIPEWPDVYAIFFVTWVLIQENDADLHLFDLHHKPSFE